MIGVFFNTILPLFSVIALGFVLKKRGIISQEWEKVANRLVYNVSIPAMLIKVLAGSKISKVFSFKILLSVAFPIIFIVFVSFLLSKFIFKGSNDERATFIQSSIHGNIGYMAYAVGYYAFPEAYFHNLVIISSFLILFQNLVSVVILTLFTRKLDLKRMWFFVASTVFKNPIIISAFVGSAISVVNISIPQPLMRFITIVANMGLPTALFLIGAGLIFGEMKLFWEKVMVISFLKLLVLPFTAYLFSMWIKLDSHFSLPLLILFSSPSAVVTYVLATQIGGSPKLASLNVSIQTLLCAISYSVVIAKFMRI